MLQRKWLKALTAVATVVGLLMVGCGGTNAGGGTTTGGTAGTTGGTTGGTTTRAAFVGEAVCKGCHAETREHWSETAHAHALQSLKDRGQQTNAACLACHTLGFGQEGGFVNEETTPGLANVQCENCHGAGGDHVASPSHSNITRVVQSKTCGGCHTGSHNPQYDEWKLSKHSIGSFDVHSDTCVTCHTAEGFLIQESQVLEPEAPVIARAESEPLHATTNVECWACHDPHEKKADVPAQLREDSSTLCRKCHTFREAQGTTPVSEFNTRPMHNPQAEVVNAAGGFKWNENATDPNKAFTALTLDATAGLTHKEATEGDCARCHVYTITQAKPTESLPNKTGHDFRPNLLACGQAGCHSNLGRQEEPVKPVLDSSAIEDGASDNVKAFYHARQSAQQDRLKAVKSSLDKVDLNKLTPVQLMGRQTAKWNYDLCVAEKSDGIHNWQYADALLDESERILALLPKK